MQTPIKEKSNLRVTGLCEANSPGTDDFPAQRASNAENVSIWWRHHILVLCYSGELYFWIDLYEICTHHIQGWLIGTGQSYDFPVSMNGNLGIHGHWYRPTTRGKHYIHSYMCNRLDGRNGWQRRWYFSPDQIHRFLNWINHFYSYEPSHLSWIIWLKSTRNEVGHHSNKLQIWPPYRLYQFTSVISNCFRFMQLKIPHLLVQIHSVVSTYK